MRIASQFLNITLWQKDYPKAILSDKSQPVRVLYLDHTAQIGGGEIAIYNLIVALDKSRVTPIFMLAAEGPLATRLRNAEIETYIVPLAPKVNDVRKDSLGITSLLNLNAVVICLAYIAELVKLMHQLNVRIVHTNSLKAHVYGGIAARIAGLPVVWHIRDNIDSSYLPDIVARVIRAMARRIPACVIANSNSTLQRLALRPDSLSSVVYSGIKPSPDQQHSVIHDGFSGSDFLAAFGLEEELPRPARVVMVGRIAEWKGQHIFLEAASQVLKALPETRFQIIGAPLFGEQEYERRLHEQVKELGIEAAVEFLGFREDVSQLVAKSDLLVHASIIGEPFGQVVVEGMLCGKPVIATNGGGLPEIVVPNVTGILVRMGDADEMAVAIRYILTHPVEAIAMGIAGQKRALENFSISASASRVHQVYEDVLSLESKIKRKVHCKG